MIPYQFANYNREAQQRLGFLKVLTGLDEAQRLGKEQLLDRLLRLYRPRSEGADTFDPETLLQEEEIPSWQPGFTKRNLDRLLLWGEMLGVLTAAGRFSEWAHLLRTVSLNTPGDNPFRLSLIEKAFFVQLLLYHDQVMAELILRLARHAPGTWLSARRASLETVAALASLLDRADGPDIQTSKMRRIIRGLLARIAADGGMKEAQILANPDTRSDALRTLETAQGRMRLAEFHAVCRFEQLADLGLVTKADPARPAVTADERRQQRRAWDWRITPQLASAAAVLGESVNLEQFLTSHWIEFCEIAFAIPLTPLDPFKEPLVAGRLIDDVLPKARRQLGPIQLHTWACLTSLEALRSRRRMEIGSVYDFFHALRRNPEAGHLLRLSGQPTFLGETVSLLEKNLSAFLETHCVHRPDASKSP